MFQLIDFLNPQGTIGITENLYKIEFNLGHAEVLKKEIENRKQDYKNSVSIVVPLGRWILIYQNNLLEENSAIMYFVDFRVDADNFLRSNIFTFNIVNGIKQIQSEFDSKYNDSFDTVELTFAEPHEFVLKPNLFICRDDDKVLQIADKLGAFPAIQNLKPGDRVKVNMVDEKVIIDDRPTVHVYALIHFGGHNEENNIENGFTYIKLYDLLRNPDRIDDFLFAVKGTGVDFETGLLIEKFTKERLN